MRSYLILLALFFYSALYGQESLIVYGLKGTAYSMVSKKETMVKVGNLLPLASSLRLEEGSSVTLLCKQGIRFVISNKGTYSLFRYKDSCKAKTNSVSSNYLSYLWGQMYANSNEHKKEKHESTLAVSRGEGVQGKNTRSGNKRIIEFSRAMDTVRLGERDFQLCWNCFDMEGFYQFRLYDRSGKNIILKDSTEDNFISTSRFIRSLQTGSVYRWNIIAPRAGSIRKRVIERIGQDQIDGLVEQLTREEMPGEDSASRYFRIAFTLEKKHYLGEAYHYYQMAHEADLSNNLIRSAYVRFCNEFYLPQ